MAFKRGQLGIEFFLVVAFVLVLGSVLSASVDEQVIAARALDRAALAKSAVDAVSHAINLVTLEGNGALASREVFFPAETQCIQYSSARKALYCDVAGAGKVYGVALYREPTVLLNCFSSGTQGWFLVTVNGTSNGAQVNCTKLG
ncbi:MAG: hypothetical protein ACP5O3_01090 [Candidatus Micrarchaeia archaeon]